ncbi:MAG TPA: hypothetical protein VEA59_04850, partial [Patescibacteria group bacterium]|nr:hypothetical protein [Patescibacteria group bacterium]
MCTSLFTEKILFGLLVVSLLFAQAPDVLAASGVSYKFSFSAYIKNSGTPVMGTQNVQFDIYDSLTGGTLKFTQGPTSTIFNEGFLTVQIGPVPSDLFDDNARYLELSINGVALSPRLEINGSPYALNVDNLVGSATAGIRAKSSAGFNLNPYGTGAGQTTQLRYYDLLGNYAGFQAPDSITSSYVLRLPGAAPAVAGQTLIFSGAGATSWGTATVALNDVQGAVGSGALFNKGFGQVWNWDSLTTGTGLALTGTAVTTGTLLSVGGTLTAGRVVPISDIGYDLGSSGARWNTVHSGTITVHGDATNTKKLNIGFVGSNAVISTDGSTGLILSSGAGAGGALTFATGGNLGVGTITPYAKLAIVQGSPGETIFAAQRVGPSGDFINYIDESGNLIFKVDNSGNITAPGSITGSATTISSTTSPQLAVEYNGANKTTISISSTGTYTQTFTGSTSNAVYQGTSNSTLGFQWKNAAGSTIVDIDTLNSRLGLGTNIPQAAFHNAYASAASLPAALLSGAWFSGGSSSTTVPQFLIQPSGASSNNWSVNGTGLGVNAASGFSGNLLDAQINAVRMFAVDSSGNLTAAGTASFNGSGTTSFSGPVAFGSGVSLPAGGTMTTGGLLATFGSFTSANANQAQIGSALINAGLFGSQTTTGTGTFGGLFSPYISSNAINNTGTISTTGLNVGSYLQANVFNASGLASLTAGFVASGSSTIVGTATASVGISSPFGSFAVMSVGSLGVTGTISPVGLSATFGTFTSANANIAQIGSALINAGTFGSQTTTGTVSTLGFAASFGTLTSATIGTAQLGAANFGSQTTIGTGTFGGLNSPYLSSGAINNTGTISTAGVNVGTFLQANVFNASGTATLQSTLNVAGLSSLSGFVSNGSSTIVGTATASVGLTTPFASITTASIGTLGVTGTISPVGLSASFGTFTSANANIAQIGLGVLGAATFGSQTTTGTGTFGGLATQYMSSGALSNSGTISTDGLNIGTFLQANVVNASGAATLQSTLSVGGLTSLSGFVSTGSSTIVGTATASVGLTTPFASITTASIGTLGVTGTISPVGLSA